MILIDLICKNILIWCSDISYFKTKQYFCAFFFQLKTVGDAKPIPSTTLDPTQTRSNHLNTDHRPTARSRPVPEPQPGPKPEDASNSESTSDSESESGSEIESEAEDTDAGAGIKVSFEI